MTRVVVANIPHTLTHEEAVADLLRALKHASRLRSVSRKRWVLLLCEMDAGNDRALDTALARLGLRVRVYHRDKRTQIVVPADRRTVGRYRRLTSGWEQNPPRGMSIVDDLTDPDPVDSYVAMHLPNGRRNRSRSPRFRAVQDRFWRLYDRRAGRRFQRWATQGKNAVGGGDINDKRKGLQLHPAQVVVKQAGLMWIYAIPAAGYRVRVGYTAADHENLGDHPQLIADVDFIPTQRGRGR